MEECPSTEKFNEMSVYDNTSLNSPPSHSINTYTEISLVFHVNTPTNSNDDFDMRLIELDMMEEHENLSPANFDSMINGQISHANTPTDSNDDDDMELLELDVMEKHENLSPANFDSVINGQISHIPLRHADQGLIGDYSEPFCLPVINGKQKDLTCISVYTMAELVKGEYVDTVNSYRVFDCRYPYEYNGGHIKGAENLYTEQHIYCFLMSTLTETVTVVPKPKRNIIIFHCEFSTHRGPKLSKFLRTKDRAVNKIYPALHYPEIYLLDGGYKEFYKCFHDLCEPMAYLPMLDPAYRLDYQHFRAATKSWDRYRGTKSRSGKSWSRLSL